MSAFDPLDACIHCGLCLDTCPTYRETGNEAQSPRGRLHLMRAVEEGRATADEVRGALDACLGCRACETACPSGVRYGSILEDYRAAHPRPRSRLESFLVDRVLWRGALLERLRGPVRVGAAVARAAASVPGPEALRRRLRLAPRPEPAARAAAADPATGPVVRVVRGCVSRALFPASEAASVELLRRAGYRVETVEEPQCCGALAAHAGRPSLARSQTAGMVGRLAGPAPVLAPAAGCAAHLAAHGSGSAVRDLATLLLDAPVALRFRSGDAGTAVFQDPCHLRHGLGVSLAPREMLARAGFRVVEGAEADLCCGSAGSYNVARPGMAERLGRRKRAVLRDSGAARVVTDNPGCAIQLAAHAVPGDAPAERLARVLLERLEREPTA